ncbi:mucin-19-like [Syngnathus typhle]|uniref:mucin-19-like n=1 Tax=Syngnathus typhle TaxID=161592 RepID=UPI002A698BE0|nr:mucin-19-like [Syngnathus typhle]
MKLDLKLLCLALVLCHQSVQAGTCTGSPSAATCNGKPGGELELKATGATGDVTWMKGPSGPTTNTAKYTKSETFEATLKILTLVDGDEETYKATADGIPGGSQDFIVNVADCFGSGTEATCNGPAGKPLKLKATGASGTVTWVKIDTPSDKPIEDNTDGYEKSGTHDVCLKINDLSPEFVGTYKASGGGMAKDQKFKVAVTTTNGGDSGGSSGGADTKENTSGGGGGGGSSGGADTNAGAGGGGSSDNKNAKNTTTTTTSLNAAKGLSYSPALLVTTLVHLLQLAY